MTMVINCHYQRHDDDDELAIIIDVYSVSFPPSSKAFAKNVEGLPSKCLYSSPFTLPLSHSVDKFLCLFVLSDCIVLLLLIYVINKELCTPTAANMWSISGNIMLWARIYWTANATNHCWAHRHHTKASTHHYNDIKVTRKCCLTPNFMNAPIATQLCDVHRRPCETDRPPSAWLNLVRGWKV